MVNENNNNNAPRILKIREDGTIVVLVQNDELNENLNEKTVTREQEYREYGQPLFEDYINQKLSRYDRNKGDYDNEPVEQDNRRPLEQQPNDDGKKNKWLWGFLGLVLVVIIIGIVSFCNRQDDTDAPVDDNQVAQGQNDNQNGNTDDQIQQQDSQLREDVKDTQDSIKQDDAEANQKIANLQNQVDNMKQQQDTEQANKVADKYQETIDKLEDAKQEQDNGNTDKMEQALDSVNDTLSDIKDKISELFNK